MYLVAGCKTEGEGKAEGRGRRWWGSNGERGEGAGGFCRWMEGW